jgi:iron complex transport system permease protein
MGRAGMVAVILAAAYLGLALLGTATGAVAIPPERVVRIVAQAAGWNSAEELPQSERFIVLQMRIPQVILLGLVGAALACSGAALQATFENPLADSGVLGVNGGAALAAVIAIHTGLASSTFLALPLCAFTGGLAAALVVYSLTYLAGRPTIYTLLLTGVAVGSICTAGVTLVMILSGEQRIQQLLFWLVGGVRNQTWEHVWLATPGIVIGVAALLGLHRRLDALLLGEEQALAVGVPVVATRILVLALTALVTGAAIAVSGTIGFVGLMVPHLIRRWSGARSSYLLPGCITGGAAFLTACDLLSRSLSAWMPLHLGILTAFLGGPAFVLILLHKRASQP